MIYAFCIPKTSKKILKRKIKAKAKVESKKSEEHFSADFIGKKLKESYDSCLHRDI